MTQRDSRPSAHARPGRRARAWLLPAVLFACCQPLAAQEWYHVEAVVFAYDEPAHADGERFPPAPAAPDDQRAIVLLEDLPDLADEPFDGEEEPAGDAGPAATPGAIAFRRLDAAQLRLAPVAARLRSSPGYHVLEHVAWRQPGLSGAAARPVRIGAALPTPRRQAPADDVSDAGQPPQPIEGTLRLRAGNTLRVEADLLYRGGPQPVRLTQERQVRLGELHYLDHPWFGVLVQVTVFRLPEADAAEGDGVN